MLGDRPEHHPEGALGRPVRHSDPPAGPDHAQQLRGGLLLVWGEHRAEDADDEVEALVVEPAQVGRVALLESQVLQSERLGAGVPRRDEVGGDVDAEDLGRVKTVDELLALARMA